MRWRWNSNDDGINFKPRYAPEHQYRVTLLLPSRIICVSKRLLYRSLVGAFLRCKRARTPAQPRDATVRARWPASGRAPWRGAARSRIARTNVVRRTTPPPSQFPPKRPLSRRHPPLPSTSACSAPAAPEALAKCNVNDNATTATVIDTVVTPKCSLGGIRRTETEFEQFSTPNRRTEHFA